MTCIPLPRTRCAEWLSDRKRLRGRLLAECTTAASHVPLDSARISHPVPDSLARRPMRGSRDVSIALVAIAITVSAASGQSGGPRVPTTFERIAQLPQISRFTGPAVSPDGRRIAFLAASDDGAHNSIWTIAITGRGATELVRGPHTHGRPVWFPGGDRIAYTSDQLSSIMTIGIDRATGRAVGTPRRVSLEPPRGFAIAPDGRSIVYAMRGDSSSRLKVIPATGGEARTILEQRADIGVPSYSADGMFVYFASNPNNGGLGRSISRVSATGGPASVVVPLPAGVGGTVVDPAAGRILVRTNDRGIVLTLTGDTVSTFAWLSEIGPVGTFGFTRDGSGLITATTDMSAAIHVVPLAGGSVRKVGEGRYYERPIAWLSDDRIYYSSDTLGYGVVTADGRTRSFVAIQPTNLVIPGEPFRSQAISSNGRYLAFAPMPATGGPGNPYYIYDTQTRQALRVTNDWANLSYTAPERGAGIFWNETLAALQKGHDIYAAGNATGGEYLYAVLDGDDIQLRAASVGGQSRLIRTMPRRVNTGPPAIHNNLGVGALAVSGRRVAIARCDAVFLATDPTGPPEEILSVPGGCVSALAFSPDGTTMFVGATVGTGPTAKLRAFFIGVGANGEVTRPARSVDLAANGGFKATWTPDNQAVLFLGYDPTKTRSWLWRIPVAANEVPKKVTRDVGAFWDYVMSPDGRAVAVNVEQNNGSTLWRIQLDKAGKINAASRGRIP